MRAFVVVISGLLLAAPGLAQASEDAATSNGTQQPAVPPTGNSVPATAEDDSERQICRRVETNTGSRVPWRRVCMTERQWRAYNRQN